MTESEIENATLEAIYWWNRDENYYHNNFSKLDKIYEDKELLEFFTVKVFEIFLREYSIRRNISAGYQNVEKFIDELFEFNFIAIVKKGDTSVIDKVSNKIKANASSTDRQTKSLLSKIAFLINPNDFSLYDTLAKESIWHLVKDKNKIKKYQLENYSDFINQTHLLRTEISSNGHFLLANEILDKFQNTSAYYFFKSNSKAFETRIVDKYLWLLQQDKNGRKINNREYIKLIKFDRVSIKI